jgi:hypothetical protein
VQPGSGGATRGVALATFSDAALGRACLAFEDSTKVKRRGTARSVVTNGTLTFLGGSQAAARLLGGGDYAVEARPDGALHYDGKGVPATGGPLPPVCGALAGP